MIEKLAPIFEKNRNRKLAKHCFCSRFGPTPLGNSNSLGTNSVFRRDGTEVGSNFNIFAAFFKTNSFFR